MGKKGEPVTRFRKPKASEELKVNSEKFATAIVNPVESDEFNSPVLGKQWQWHANYHQFFGMPTAFGTMRIYTHKLSEGFKNLWEVPNLLLQKTPADQFMATAKLRFTSKADGQFGGIIMMGHNYQALVVRREGRAFKLLVITCQDADKGKPQQEELIATLKPTAEDKIDYKPGIHEEIYLRLKVTNAEAGAAHGGKPLVSFAWSQNGKKFTDCGGQYQMKEGKWIGAKFGFVAAETNPKVDKGWVDADWIRIEPLTQR